MSERCDCGRPMDSAATDECVNVAHRATDATLGLRDLPCGCCLAVDATALELLRQSRVPSASEAAPEARGAQAEREQIAAWLESERAEDVAADALIVGSNGPIPAHSLAREALAALAAQVVSSRVSSEES